MATVAFLSLPIPAENFSAHFLPLLVLRIVLQGVVLSKVTSF